MKSTRLIPTTKVIMMAIAIIIIVVSKPSR